MIQFTYDGIGKRITASADCVVSFVLKGGGGGAGGRDSPGRPGVGTDASTVSGQLNLAKGNSIFVAVGAGGIGGESVVAGYGGGLGGYSLNGFSGGTGGAAGPIGLSGAGGGGGGATVLYKIVNNSASILAVAGGGAGGGGGGNRDPADGYLLPESSYTYFEPILSNALYYPYASINGGYCQFLNDLGIWKYPERENIFLWDVYLTAGTYSAELSVDNWSILSIDGIREAFGYESANLQSFSSSSVSSKPFNVTNAGWYKLRVYAINFEGIASVAFRIKQGSNVILTSRSPFNLRSVTNIQYSRGGQGQNHERDGGGAGGGGGGYPGGRGGLSPIYDVGASGGTPGASYNAVNTSSFDGNGNAKYYGRGLYTTTSTNVIVSAAQAAGGNGYAAFISNVNNSISVKNERAGLWTKPSAIYRRTKNNTWAPFTSIYVRTGGEWKQMYGEAISYTNVSLDDMPFNRESGPPVPYYSGINEDTGSAPVPYPPPEYYDGSINEGGGF